MSNTKVYCYEVIDNKDVRIFMESDPMLRSTYLEGTTFEIYQDLVNMGWEKDDAVEEILRNTTAG